MLPNHHLSYCKEEKKKSEIGNRMEECRWSVVYLGMVLGMAYLMDLHLNLHLNQTIPVEKNLPPLPLRFTSDAHGGAYYSFKILQVADLHYAGGPTSRCRDVSPFSIHCSDLNSTRFLRRLIAAESPDFIAFTGDNIFASSAESLFAAFAPAIEARIPWAAVLGNHDHESAAMSRQEIIFLASLMDYSFTKPYPSRHYQNIHGFGNYEVNVAAPASNTTLLRLVFLDSGHRETVDGRRTYGWIRESQLRWMSRPQRTAARQLGFFHIPIPELREQLYDPRSGTRAVKGSFQEAVACSSVHSGVLSSLVSVPGMTAVFHGHDHLNDFCANLSGVWSCYGGGFGYHAYGKSGWPRRARVIEARLHHRLSSIHTWKRLDDSHLTKIDHHLLWEI